MLTLDYKKEQMSIKRLPQLLTKCQQVFNEFVRLRDIEDHYFRCISCGEIKDERFMNAGHFYNVGHYPGLRFEEDNCNGQCIHCNNFLHGNLIEYRDNLFVKIGSDRFEKLKIKAGLYKRNGYKFSHFEIEEKIKYFQSKIKELKNLRS
jgi:hypothetical protein